MLPKRKIEQIINYALNKGADYAEVFLENSKKKIIKLSDSKIDNINNENLYGIGVRLAYKNETYYVYSNDLKIKNILNLIDNIKILGSKKKLENINLPRLKKYHDDIKIPHDSYSSKYNLLHELDRYTRSLSDKVSQVEISFLEYDQKVIVASSDNVYKEDNRILTRMYFYVYVKENDITESAYYAPGAKQGYEFLDKLKLKEIVQSLTESAIKKLDSIPCPGGNMSVIIGNGFGGVIFHEACGHGLEATSVASNESIFSGKLNQMIASPIVTLVDDATIKGSWGSSNIDDEGSISQKNILIKDGKLNKYLIDKLNNRTMKQKISSSGRRENYKFAPTSRMSNTYLAPRKDKISDMIKSIEYGLYAKGMGGGSVNPHTGDFNFAVNEAYLIEKGKITSPVKGASLIGNSTEILKEISMISDDLALESGYCGSVSGSVPVTVGEPTIKVDNILVGGVK